MVNTLPVVAQRKLRETRNRTKSQKGDKPCYGKQILILYDYSVEMQKDFERWKQEKIQ